MYIILVLISLDWDEQCLIVCYHGVSYLGERVSEFLLCIV